MNKNLLDYFQAKQQEQMLQNQASPMPEMLLEYPQGMPMQSQPQPQMNYQRVQPEPYNPFDPAIKRAVESARASFSPTSEQSNKALRGGLLAFSDAIRNSPKERGFAANVSSLGGALSPALASYDNSNSAFEAQNHALASQIVDYNKYMQAMAQKEEENAWNRDFRERELEERKQNHLFSNFMKNAALRQQGKNNSLGEFVSAEAKEKAEDAYINPKIWDARAKNNMKIVDDMFNSYQKNSEVIPAIDQLSNLLEKSKLTGEGYYSALKRFIAQQTGNNEDILNAENLGQFYLEWLSDNTSGVLSDKDIAYYSKGFAGIAKNPQASVAILSSLKNKLSRQQEVYKKRLESYEKDPGANLHSLNYFNAPNETISAVNNNLGALPTMNILPEDDDLGFQEK